MDVYQNVLLLFEQHHFVILGNEQIVEVLDLVRCNVIMFEVKKLNQILFLDDWEIVF